MSINRKTLTPEYSISTIIKGGWHLAGGHGKISEEVAIKDMHAFVKAGITTFDCADIYTGVEELIGKFFKKYKPAFQDGSLAPVQIHTKYVPDYDALKDLTKADTEKIIDRSLKRLGVERLDLVQFAWWDYRFPQYVEAAIHLAELQKAGKIRYLGVTNFDGPHLKEILDAGVPLLTNQVQYSVLDRRVENDQTELNRQHGVSYLCYGVVAGGFLSDRYLDVPEPNEPLENRSLTKYKLIIDDFGGYELFQHLLKTLRQIADQYDTDIAAVASRYILQKERVGGLIIGARNQKHLPSLAKIGQFSLDDHDLARIESILKLAKGPLGPFYALERDKNGKHGAIMRYNLNGQRGE